MAGLKGTGGWSAAGCRIACLLAASSMLVGCVQGLFYHPDRVIYDTPARAGLKFEEVRFRSPDGTLLYGWFIPAAGYDDPRQAKGTVVHYHGNAQNLSAHWQFVEWLPKRGYNLFVFDYRGYGASEGAPEPKGVFEDSGSALDYVRSRADVNPDRLAVLGQSLGGANAIAVVGSGNRRGVRAIVIEATFFSYSSIASDRVSGSGVLMDDTYSPDRYIGRLAPIPLLLMHGTSDAVIPVTHGRRLFDQAKEPKRLIVIESSGHIEAFAPKFGATYRDIVVDFLDGALPEKMAPAPQAGSQGG
ncbi:MAG: alpha/beta hydrolase [Burkholderiales bacterium]